MKGILKTAIVFLMTAFLAVGIAGCGAKDGNNTGSVNSESVQKRLSYQVFASQTDGKTTRVEISITSLDGKYKLSDIMQKAREAHSLEYEASSGMVTSINGTANTADFSYCWMLYTTDAEMANMAWGSITIGDQTLGSAIVGMEALEVLEDQIYVWEYTAF